LFLALGYPHPRAKKREDDDDDDYDDNDDLSASYRGI